jgi:hypothetical protein
MERERQGKESIPQHSFRIQPVFISPLLNICLFMTGVKGFFSGKSSTKGHEIPGYLVGVNESEGTCL